MKIVCRWARPGQAPALSHLDFGRLEASDLHKRRPSSSPFHIQIDLAKKFVHLSLDLLMLA
ncbi:hypothetical protein NC651_034831 [Populus alba x Populus x berolinensis]|nr:hypothetical protein NC651_034831 [Populus alba x Populus x berolinensis]